MAGNNKAGRQKEFLIEDEFDLLIDDEDDGYEPLEGPVSAPAAEAAAEPAKAATLSQKTGPLSGLFRFNYVDESDKDLDAMFSGSGEQKQEKQEGANKPAAASQKEKPQKPAVDVVEITLEDPEELADSPQEGMDSTDNADSPEEFSEGPEEEADDLPDKEDTPRGIAAAAFAREGDSPVSMPVYLGFMLLYCIPVVGVIAMLILSFTAKNRHLKTFTRAFLFFMNILLLALTELSLLGLTKYLF